MANAFLARKVYSYYRLCFASKINVSYDMVRHSANVQLAGMLSCFGHTSTKTDARCLRSLSYTQCWYHASASRMQTLSRMPLWWFRLNQMRASTSSGQNTYKDQVLRAPIEPAGMARASWLSEPHVLVRQIYRSCQNNVRDADLWKKYVHRTAIMAPFFSPQQLALVVYSFGTIRYRDPRLIHCLTPLVVRSLPEFPLQSLVLIIHALRQLEIRRFDTIELLVNQICHRFSECTSQDLALTANSLSAFLMYHDDFWKRLVDMMKHPIKLDVSHAAVIMISLARIDLRSPTCLINLWANVSHHIDKLSNELFSSLVLAVAKLDMCDSSIRERLLQETNLRLQQSSSGSSLDTQWLCKVTFSLVCLLGSSTEVNAMSD
eukprot:GHVT01095762.1.p1 GENE.GHVT01095762.1~~GHVT01095762.1.p1  ORF type:complete len:376 (-),score=-1.89 GHVT01095762.1:884-2011(-)